MTFDTIRLPNIWFTLCRLLSRSYDSKFRTENARLLKIFISKQRQSIKAVQVSKIFNRKLVKGDIKKQYSINDIIPDLVSKKNFFLIIWIYY